MTKKKKAGLIILGIIVLYVFLYYSDEWFTITPIVFSNKSEYKMGEEVLVYGFSIQPHRYTDSCDPYLFVYTPENKRLNIGYPTCFLPVGKHPPLLFYMDEWDQKIVTNATEFPYVREQVDQGEYFLNFMRQKLPIIIIP